MSILEKVDAFSREYGLLPRSGWLLAAVSGGADSVCLMDLLDLLQERWGYRLAVCHFDHGLRGAESREDALFTERLAQERGLPFFGGSGDAAAESRRSGCGLEESARTLRYAFFADCSRRLEGARVATAHTADDNAETLLMHLLRGSGLRGLGGIPPRRDEYVRPMLTVTRRQVEDWLGERGIPHREDSSNDLDDNLRNRIRHRVTPALAALSPRWASNASRAALDARGDEEMLEEQAAAFLRANRRGDRLPVEPLRALAAPLRRRVLRAMAPEALSREQTLALEALALGPDPSASLDLPGGRVSRDYGELLFGDTRRPESFVPRTLAPGETVSIPELGLRVSLVEAKNAEKNGPVYNSFTDCLFKKSAICGMITIRPRGPGDTLKLPGRGTKTLKKLFTEEKIPRLRRESIPVAADGNGVLAVRGLGVDARAAAGPEEAALILHWEDEP